MNTYQCSNGGEWPQNIVAETASKARYQYYLSLESCEPYSEWFRYLRSKLVHKFKPSDLYMKDTSEFERTIKSRGIEFAYIGMSVEVNGVKGIICGTNSSCNLDIVILGNSHTNNCHPYWRVKYFDSEGKLIKEFKDEC